MKTKEEIEKLATEHANLKPNFDRVEEEYYNSGAINAYESFTKGYTQCQEDMSDKKYTEEDMIAFAYRFSSINVADFRKHLKDFDINLKNKQD